MLSSETANLPHALDSVREYARTAVASDDLFRVDEEKLIALSRELATIDAGESPLIVNALPVINQKLYFILYFGVANFSYRNPLSGREYVYRLKETGEVLYRTNAFITALLRLPVTWDSPESILRLSDDEWEEGLQLQDNDLYLAEQRIDSIRRLARAIQVGEVQGISEDGIRTDTLFRTLMKTGLFEDLFLKRIQIVLYYLQGVVRTNGLEFSPEPRFTAMADYRLPQVFINTGVLVLDDTTMTHLANGYVFEKEAPEEILLRAYTISICGQLAKLMDSSEAEVDGKVWAYSQHMIATKTDIVPPPRVATDCY